jgi:AcrR family transcriptional regulator
MTEEAVPKRRVGRPTTKEGSPIPDTVMLQVAVERFGTLGYEGMSIRKLNTELGVSHNLVHQRYGSKEGLFYAAVDYAFERISVHTVGLSAPRAGESDLDYVRRFIIGAVEANQAYPYVLRLLTTEATIDSPRLRYIFERHLRPGWGAFEALLRLQKRGTIRPVPMRVIYFMLLHGASAIGSSQPLVALIDHEDPLWSISNQSDPEVIATILLGGILVNPESLKQISNW